MTNIEFKCSPTTTTGYVFFLSRKGTKVDVPEMICANSPSPNCTATLKPGDYEWYVGTRGTPENCPDESTSHFSLKIEGCNDPPTDLKPDKNSDVPVSTTLKWSGDTAATYDVFLEEGKTKCETTTPTKQVKGTSLDIALKANTTYAWRVRESSNSSCAAPKFSDCATFKTCDPPGKFDLKEPRIAGTHVTLSWTPAQGASKYEVYTTSFGSGTWHPTESTSICLPLWNIPSPDFTWYVVAYSGNCWTKSNEDKQKENFKTGDCARPTLVSPEDKSPPMKAGEITFVWTAPQVDACNEDYVYQVVIENLAPPPGTKKYLYCMPWEGTTCSTTLSAGNYQWYVKAMGECTSQSEPRKLTVVWK